MTFNKVKMFSTFAVILMLSMTAMLITSPNATAQTLISVPTYAYCTASPNPVGVGQTVQITGWLNQYPPTYANTTLIDIPVMLWTYTFSVTDPSGNTQTKSITSDIIGTGFFLFTPTSLGNWTIKMSFPETLVNQTNLVRSGQVNGGPFDFLAATSNIIVLNVQGTSTVQGFTPAPLPTGYWQRPVDAQNREWYAIDAPWLGYLKIGGPGGDSSYDGMGNVNPYTTAPNTAHILWTLPVQAGGNVGGIYGSESYYTGDGYESEFYPAIIMNGIFYRDTPEVNLVQGLPITATNPLLPGSGFEAIDLRTGKVLWSVPNGTITFGQLLRFDSPNQQGIIPFLWNAQLQVFNAANGQWLMGFNNIPTTNAVSNAGQSIIPTFAPGSIVADPSGSGAVLSYIYNYPQRKLALWNSTWAFVNPNNRPAPAGPAPLTANDYNDYWRAFYGQTYNFLGGIEWNVTIPDLSSYGVVQSVASPAIRLINTNDGVIICRFTGAANATYPVGYVVDIGYSMTDGHQMWVQTRTDPNQVETGSMTSFTAVDGPGTYFIKKQETEVWHCYSTATGALLWTSQPDTSPWGSYYTTMGPGPAFVAYGRLYTTGYDGMIRAYDIKTGTLLWSYYDGDTSETPYGTYPFFGGFAIADGKIYVSQGEHHISQPVFRGYGLVCVDANTGQFLWKIEGWDKGPIIAEGELIALNQYDMLEYAYGTGQSATTVQAPLTGITAGNTIAITGTVTDQSPGKTCLGIPAAGTPAISDDSMSAWMQYLYMQQAMPTNATGVPVNLVAIDSSGVSTPIGTVMSDITGFYNTHWTVPTTPGDYKIIANFAGSKSYYSSSAVAAVTVVAAAPTSTPLTANDVASQVVSQLPVQTPIPTAPSASDVASQVVTQLPSMTTTDMILIAAIVVAILIGVVNLVLQLRKKQA